MADMKMKHNVPVQSLIDHIKTATDVDPWAKEMAEELLKEREAKSVLSNRVCEAEPFRYVRKGFCPKCHQEMEWLFNRKHCGFCGQEVQWK